MNYSAISSAFVSFFFRVFPAILLGVFPYAPLHAQAAGSLVPCFNTGTGFNGNSNTFAQLPNGKILCAGDFVTYNGSAANRICRLNADGSLDGSFSGAPAINGQIYCMVVLSNGQILISGSFTLPKAGIARLNTDGTVDGTFNMAGAGSNGGRIQSFSVQPDGKIVLVGDVSGGFTQYNGTTVNGMARLNADGSLDPAFNSGAGSGFNGASFNAAVAVQPDGKILVGGNFTTYKSVPVPTGIIRLNSDGSRDNTFNPGMAGGVSGSVGFPIIVQSNGQILISGSFNSYNGFSRNCLARLNADGSLDNAFNPGGPDMPGVTMAQLSDGRLLITGTFSLYDGMPRNRVVLTNGNGNIDPTFNPVGAPGATVWSCFVLSDGTAMLGGTTTFTQYNGTTVNGIARIWLDNPASISSTSPQRNTHNNALSTPLTLNFPQTMSAATASQSAFRVWGGQTGLRSGSYSGGGTSTIGFTPTQPYKPGELVSATLRCGAQTSMGAPVQPQVIQFRARAGEGPATFYETRKYQRQTAGGFSEQIVSGYFNADPYLDFAVGINDVPNVVGGIEVFFGSASGEFTHSITLSSGFRFSGLEVADMNNDGKPDIVATGGSWNGPFSVYVFINNGSGGFLAPVITPASNSTQVEIAIADLNGDGNLDVFTVSDQGGYAIFFNNGTGALTAGQAVGLDGLGAAAGDIDNDGDIDLVYTNFSAGQANTLINNGLGNFTNGQTLTVGVNAYTLRLADVDNNGFLDVIAAQTNGGANDIKIFRNTAGALAMTPNQTISLPGTLLLKIVLFDANGDGFLDIAGANGGNQSVAYLPNNSGTFGAPVSTFVGPTNGITSGDVDNDGDLDLITVGGDIITVLANAIKPQIVSTTPLRNSHTVNPVSLVQSWNLSMTSATATLPAPASIPHSLYVWGDMTGYRTLPSGGAATQSSSLTTFTPAKPFLPGERITVTLVNARSTEFVPAKPVVYDFRAKAGVGPGTFQPGPILGPPMNPQRVVTADINLDGRIDLLVPDEPAGTIRIYFGDLVPGSFTLPSALTATLPKRIIVSDFNNDGKPDIASVNYSGSNNVEIFLATTPGMFAAPALVSGSMCTGGRNIVTTDFNADGNIDIISGCEGSANINVLLGNGNGTFQTVQVYPSGLGGTSITDLAVGDFDNDGDMDLVCSDDGSNNMSLVRNQGDGTFAAGFVFASGEEYHSLAVADFNDDGNLDIAVSNFSPSPDRVRIFLGNGLGAFPNVDDINSVGTNLRGVTAGDFNGDGRMDLAVANFGVQAKFTVLLRNPTTYTIGSAFATPVTYNSNLLQTHDINASDLDGDGDLDLFMQGTNYAAIHFNALPLNLVTASPARNAASALASSPITLTYTQPMTTATASLPALNIWGGFSGYKTGGTRSVAGNTVTANVGGFRPGEQVWVTHQMAQSTTNVKAKNTVYGFTARAGAGPATFIHLGLFGVGGNGYQVGLADADGNGILDVITSNKTTNTSSVLYGTIGGNLAAEATPSPYSASNASGLAVADFNNDGRPDYVVGNDVGTNVTVLINNAGTSFTPTSINVGAANNVITVNDFNGDGAMDIAVSCGDGSVRILFGNGNGTFQPFVNAGTPTAVAFQNIASGDFDGDGDIDIISTDSGGNMLRVMINDGTGNFSLPFAAFPSGGTTAFSLAITDFNGDGVNDVAVSHWGGNVAIHIGNGNGTFQAPDAYPTGAGTDPRGIVAADFNGDGFTDIAVASIGTDRLTIFMRVPSAYTAGNAFAPAVQYPVFGTGIHWLAAGDVDNDGDMDIVARYFNSANISVYLNATQPTLTSFSPPRNTQTLTTTTPVSLTYNQSMTTATASVEPFRVWGAMRGFRSGTYSQPGGAATAQIQLSPPLLPNEEVFVSVTNAQNPNLIAARPLTLQYRAGASTGPATFFATTPVQVGTMPSNIRRSVALDYNGDGFVDMAFVNEVANGVQIMQGSASGAFTLGPLVGLGGGTEPWYIAVGDFNSDGRPDMVVSCFGSAGSISVLMNTGGAFNATSNALTSPRQIAVADFNSDGAMDFAVSWNVNQVNLYYGNNNGTFNAPTTLSGAANGGTGIAAADFDNDGRTDILTFSPSVPMNATVYFRNNGLLPNGTATFDAALSLGFGTTQAPEAAQIADFNGDGNMDVVTSSVGSSPPILFTVWLGNGSGGFTASNYGSVNATGVTAGDFNGDGRLDIAAGDVQGRVQIWMNNGSGRFVQNGIANGAYSDYPVAADIDRDGDLDLLTTDVNMQLIAFLNQPAPSLGASSLLLDFGPVTVGQTSSLTATLSGTNLVSGISAGTTRSTVAAFAYTLNMGTFVTQGTMSVPGGILNGAASMNVNFTARFTPSTNGIFTTTVTVTTASATPLTLTLTAIGVLPRIPMPPVITALSTNALLIGLPLRVTGLNFANVTQASIGGISTTVNIISTSQANVILPNGLSIGQVVLTNIDGTAVSRDSVRAIVPFSPPPVVSQAVPLIGVVGDLVRVTGANFSTGATTLLVGGTVYGSTFISTTQLTFTLLPGMQGAIGIRTPNGSTTSSLIVRIIPPPTIQSISPANARPNETFTIFGENYLNVLSVTAANMRLDSTSWEIDSLRQRLTVRVLGNTAENGTIGTITLITRSGVALFTQQYSANGSPIGIPDPRILTLTPVLPNASQGAPLQEGDEILLLTANIPTGATVSLTINGVTATISSVMTSSTGAVLRLRLPQGVVPLSLQSTPNLAFRLSYGNISTTATLFFTVRAANQPSISAFAPNLGGTCSTISITGQNFGTEPRGRVMNVFVGGAPVQGFRVVSPTLIQATAGTVRTGLITLLTSGGQISTTGIFTFDPDFRCLPAMRREDSLALDAFYVATVGLNWTTSTNWTNPDVPAALRFGVKTEGNRVTEIRMPKNNVTGTIPDFVLQNLSSLRVLDLTDNGVSAQLPRNLSIATEMEILRLGKNRFSGTLPAMNGLQRLKELDLSNNEFADTLGQIMLLRNLTSLNLAANRFQGRLSAEIGRLSGLTYLNLSRNQLFGIIPDEIGTLTLLQALNLSQNRFTGRIPASLGRTDTKAARVLAAEGLLTLDLSNNALEGAIPTELSALINLRTLALDNNALTGVPSLQLAQLQRLQTLGLSGNRLTDIPSFTAIVRLDTLRLAANLLDFGALEKQVTMRPTAGAQEIPNSPRFAYTNQTPILRPTATSSANSTDASISEIRIPLDSSLTLSLFTRGANNRYAWLKNGILVQAASTLASLTVPIVSAADSGLYRCVVTNTIFPDLALTSSTVRVSVVQPISPPQDTLRLIAPAQLADDVPTLPVFVWSSVRGARAYRLEISATSGFTANIIEINVPQTAQTLASGQVEFATARMGGSSLAGFPLPASARVFWRVRAENARGLGAAAVGEFTTVAGDALVSVERLDFGRIPRGDTSRRLLRLRNLSSDALRIESLQSENPVFRILPLAAFTLGVGRDTTLWAEYRPTSLAETLSGAVVQFRSVSSNGALGALQTQTLRERLRGRGGALKLVIPNFGVIPVRTSRVAAALLINVADRALEINGSSLTLRDAGFTLRADALQNASMKAGDTLPMTLSCRADRAGVVLRDSLRVQTTLENISAEVRAETRERTPADVPVKIGVRTAGNNLPPGSSVLLEVYVVPAQGFTLDSVAKAAQPFIDAVLQMDRNVLVPVPNESSVRTRQADNSRYQSLILPRTAWTGRSAVIAQIRCIVVAGNTDTTPLLVEQVQWGEGDVIIEDVIEGTFVAAVSRAGGKRLTAPKTTSIALSALAPNPAKDEIELKYELPKSGMVTITMLDARGTEVLQVANEVQSEGKHALKVKTGWLSSGTYFVRLSALGESTSQQVQIVR